jgi:hypothetical protein
MVKRGEAMKEVIEALREARSTEFYRLRYLARDVRRVRAPGVRPTLTAAYEADLREGLARRHDFSRAIALLEAAPVVLELVRAARRLVLETGGRAAALDVVSPESRRKLHADEMSLRDLFADPLVQKLIAEGE